MARVISVLSTTGQTIEACPHGNTYPAGAISIPETSTQAGDLKVYENTSVPDDFDVNGVADIYIGGTFKQSIAYHAKDTIVDGEEVTLTRSGKEMSWTSSYKNKMDGDGVSSDKIDYNGLYTHTKNNRFRNVKDYGAAGDGTTDDSTAITNANNDGDNILFSEGTYRIASDVTLDRDKSFVFHAGAKVYVDSGVTLTIKGHISAGRYQIFDGPGTVTYGGYANDFENKKRDTPMNSRVFPEWFGAVADRTTDSYDAIQKSFNAFPYSIQDFDKGTYITSDELVFQGIGLIFNNTTIECNDVTKTVLTIIGSNNFQRLQGPVTFQHSSTPTAANAGDGLQLVNCRWATFTDIAIFKCSRGIEVPYDYYGDGTSVGLFSVTFNNIRIRDFSDYGIWMRATNAGMTGSHWSNIYINGQDRDSSTKNSVSGALYISQMDESVFNQLNIEHMKASENQIYVTAGNGMRLTFNSLHFEGADIYGNYKAHIHFYTNPSDTRAILATINSMTIHSCEYNAAGPRIFQISGNNNKIIINGLHESRATFGTSFSGNFTYVQPASGADGNEVYFNSAEIEDATFSKVKNDDGSYIIKKINSNNYEFRTSEIISVTISSDTIDYKAPYIKLDTEGSASSDNLATINGGRAGDVVILSITNASRTVTVQQAVGNIRLNGGTNVTMDHVYERLTLMYDGSQWVEISRNIW